MSLFSRLSFALRCSVPRLTHFYARSNEVLGKPTRTRESTILPNDTAIIHYFPSTAQGGVKGEFKKFFVPAFRSSPPFHPSSTPKPAQTLDFTAYRGACPQF